MSTNEYLTSRIEKASKFLNVPVGDIQTYLDILGISNDDFGFQLLEAETTTHNMIKDAFRQGLHDAKVELSLRDGKTLPSSDYPIWPEARLAAAVALLKGEEIFTKKEPIVLPTTFTTNISHPDANLNIKDTIPLANRKDRSLLEDFILEEDISIQQELNTRANGKSFIVIDQNEKIQLELSLDLLKKARRGDVIPEMIAIGANERAMVYPIQSFRRENRVKEESPFVPGTPLFNGYCDQSDEDFSLVGEDARKFIRLIVEFTNSPAYKNSKFHKFSLNSHSDRKAIMASAFKGIEDLKKTWPTVSLMYEDRKLAGTLPSLKIVNPIVRKKSDPFHSNGNITY